jgi:hypothetical protein
MTVRCAVPPGALDQAGVFAFLLCVVLAGFGDVVVEGHGLLLAVDALRQRTIPVIPDIDDRGIS